MENKKYYLFYLLIVIHGSPQSCATALKFKRQLCNFSQQAFIFLLLLYPWDKGLVAPPINRARLPPLQSSKCKLKMNQENQLSLHTYQISQASKSFLTYFLVQKFYCFQIFILTLDYVFQNW